MMSTAEEIRAAKATILFPPASSWPDIESACNALLAEANPTFLSSFFASTISPVLQHLLTSFPSPNPGDSYTLWCIRLPTFSALCKYISCGPSKTNAFKRTIDVILPSFMKWAIFILDMETQDTNTTPSELIDALVIICTTIEVPLLADTYPQLGPTLVAAYFTRLNRYTGVFFLSNETHMRWKGINSRIMTSVEVDEEEDSVRKRQFTTSSPKIASVSIAALVKAMTARPMGYSYLRDVLRSIERVVSVGSICYALYKNHVLDWCIHALWLAIRASQHDDSISQDTLEDIVYSCLTVQFVILSLLGRAATEKSASLRLFDALSRLEPLVTRSIPSSVIIRALLKNMMPFVIYTSILIPAERAIRRNSFEWLGKEGEKFTRFVQEMSEARCEYGGQGKHTCWGQQCPYFNYGGPTGGETPRCMECSQCRHVAYCSVKCHKETWKVHRMSCKDNQLLKDNNFIEDANGCVIKINPVPLRAKEMAFAFFLGTKALDANVDTILAHFVAADFSAYLHVDACISTDPEDLRGIVIEPTSSVDFRKGVPPGDIRVQILAPMTKAVMEPLESVMHGGMLQLPTLEQLKSGLGTSHPRIVRMRCMVGENPVGRWRLDM